MKLAPTYEDFVLLARIPTRHSRLGFSGSERWWNCPGSVRLIAELASRLDGLLYDIIMALLAAQDSSEFAQEGIVAHLVASWALEHRGQFPEGTPLDMQTGVRVYLEAIRERLPQRGLVLVERKFSLASLHPHLRGTADVVLYDRDQRTLIVLDFKYGKGLVVEVRTPTGPNKQLTGYGLGALHEFDEPVDQLVIGVVQPRVDHVEGPVRTTVVSAGELLDFESDLLARAHATDAPEAPRIPGPWCRFCPAAYVCDAVMERAQLETIRDFQPVPGYDPARLGRALEFIKSFRAWAEPVWSFGESEVRRGARIPGWRVKRGRATKRWVNEQQTAMVLQMDLGLSEDQVYTERELRSPAQIEERVTKDQRERVAELYRKDHSETLAQDSEGGESITLTLPESMFTAIGEDGQEV